MPTPVDMPTVTDLYALRDVKELLDSILIKSDDEFVTDVNDWHAHLSALLNHLLTLGSINCHIVIGESNFLLCEVIFGHMTKMARGG